MTIKHILESMRSADKAKLMYAFEFGIAQYVEYTTGRFVGVNTDRIRNLHPQTKLGDWREGIIK